MREDILRFLQNFTGEEIYLLNKTELAKLVDRLKIYNEEFNTWEDLGVIVKEGTSVQEALVHLTNREIHKRNERAAQIQVSISHFPYIKSADEYDYSFQPYVSKSEIDDLYTLRFIENKENILFYSTP